MKREKITLKDGVRALWYIVRYSLGMSEMKRSKDRELAK
jgi:hypothetical protein